MCQSVCDTYRKLIVKLPKICTEEGKGEVCGGCEGWQWKGKEKKKVVNVVKRNESKARGRA